MNWITEVGSELAHAAGEAASAEVRRWRTEAVRPWIEGREGPAGRTGCWIGLGLALGATIVGVGLALYVERPWRS